MNSFDGLALTGANITRYFPIRGDARSIIGAYRKYAEPHRKREASPIEMGQIPLFLLDGELSPRLMKQASERLCLKEYAALYRPFNTEIKKRLNNLHTGLAKCGRMKEDGTIAEWLQEDVNKYKESLNGDARAYVTEAVREVLDYEKAQREYAAAKTLPPTDATTGKPIAGDINEYLYEHAKAAYPLGIENILETNAKQSAIPKPKFFLDGMDGAPPPKGVRCGRDGRQMTIFGRGAEIDDSIAEIRKYLRRTVERVGAVTLLEIIRYCADMGLYKSNITLYAIGAALRDFCGSGAIFCDGAAYLKYAEVPDISSWILREYDLALLRRAHLGNKSAIFYDETGLKERLENIFDIEPIKDKRFDTLGMTTVRIGTWIADNLRYPIAFLDKMLHKILSGSSKGSGTALYGKTLREYDAYFTAERCEWLKEHIPHADTMARNAIGEAVGFDPDTARHGMSRLPKGHWASVLYSAEDYIKEMAWGGVT